MRSSMLPAAAAACCLTAPSLDAQSPRPGAAMIARTVDSLAERAVALGLTPALGVAVMMDGRTIYSRSHGMADVTRQVPADDRTLWYVASTSKSLTGFGVALLAHEGVISLDAPITRLLPRARWHPQVDADQLTLARFLSHTQYIGGGAVVQNAAFTGAIPEARWPELLATEAPTGNRDLVYDNLGYNVAAMVIDAVRPEGWRRFLQERVYAPAGMRETYAQVSGLDRRRIAMPHDIGSDGRYTTATFWKTDATMNSAGGHLATLGDLARWITVQMDSGMLDGRRVFPAAAVALAHRQLAPHTVESSRTFAYFHRDGWAAGWDIGSYEGEGMVSRFGSYHTTRSHISFLPRRRVGVVAEVTGRPGSLVTDVIAAFVYDLEAGRSDARERAERRLQELVARLARGIGQVAASDSVRAARQQPMDRPLADFAGRYENPNLGSVAFTHQGGKLSFSWGVLSGPVEVFNAPRRELRIELAGTGTVVAFAFGDSGPAREITINGDRFIRVR